MAAIGVSIEATRKRAFATAVDWPGWSRSGKSEEEALTALAACAERYARIAEAAGITFPGPADRGFEVVERVEGSGGTDFGVPGQVTEHDRRPVDAAGAARCTGLLAAAWEQFDRVAAAAPESLRKGPRGGGRDTSKVVEHVTAADLAYARELGVATRGVAQGGRPAYEALRASMLDVLRKPSDGRPLASRKWPYRHAVNYIAWHALDHLWEIEDRCR